MIDRGPTVFIIDDDPAILDALRTMAETVRLPAETFSSAHEFLEAVDPQRSGCLVVDVRMPGMNGLDLLESLKVRGINLPAIVFSGHGEVPMAVRAVKAGAIDFLEKPVREQELLDRIYAALELDAAGRRKESGCRACAEKYGSLTTREQQVMKLLVAGKSGKQVAASLGISYKTMEKFRAKVMQKMQAGSIAELVLAGVSLGLIGHDEPRMQPQGGD